MKLRLGLGTMPPKVLGAWRAFLLLSALIALLIFAVVVYTGKFTAGWQMGAAALQCFVLLPLPLFAGFSLSQSRRILMSRVAPLALWRIEVRHVCGGLFVAWAVVSGCSLALTLAFSSGTAEFEVAVAYCGFSAIYMVLITLIVAPQLGLRKFVWLLGIAPLLLIFGLDVTGHTFSDLKSAPWSLLFSGLTLLSATLVWLHNRTVRPLEAMVGQATQKSPSRKDKLADWFRLPLIDPDQKPYVLLPVLLASQLPFLFTTTSFSMLSAIGGDITAWNVVRVLMLTVYAQMFLSSRDLHWRHLLAPGGVFRRRLGQRIVMTTIVSVALFAATLLCGLFLIDVVLTRFVPHERLTLTWAASLPIASELVFAVSLVALIRGYSAANRIQTLLILFAVLIATLAVLMTLGLLTFSRPVPTFGAVGNGYLVTLLGLAAICTVAANRVWARADLASLYRKRQNPDALPEAGW